MLDNDERPAAVKASADIFGDTHAPQYWDTDRALSAEVSRSIGAADWGAWDIYLFYSPGAEWTDAGLPPPRAAVIESHGVLLATKGVLPPAADQSPLPAQFHDRAEVVAPVDQLPTVLEQVAAIVAKDAQ